MTATATAPAERHPLLQGAMDRAYIRWQDEKSHSWTLADFYKSMTASEHFACTIGNFNYQVGNGGFSQWNGNGYAEVTLDNLVDYTRWIQAHANACGEARYAEAAATVLQLLKEYDEAVTEAEGQGDNEDCHMDPMYAAIEDRKLDNRYYALDDAFLDAAEAYMAATFK